MDQVVIKTEPTEDGVDEGKDCWSRDRLSWQQSREEEEDFETGIVEQTDFSMFKVKQEFASCTERNGNIKINGTVSSKLSIYEEKRPLICTFEGCNRYFINQQGLVSHEKSHKSKNKPQEEIIIPKCEGCGFIFKMKNALKRHERNNTSTAPYVCEVCGEEFEMNCMRRQHLLDNHNPYLCQVCGYKADNKKQLAQHIRTTHNGISVKQESLDSAKCKQAQEQEAEQIQEPSEILEGKTKNGDDSTNDNIPTGPQNTTVNMSKIMEKVERFVHNGVSKYRCPFEDCDRVFTKQCGLTVHIKIHGRPKQDFQCKYCGRTFKSTKACNFHTRTRHEQTDRFKCEFEGCGRSFGVKDTLRKHMISHGEKLLKCDGCDSPFKYAHALRRHWNTKTAQAPYVCQTCREVFDMECQLQQHIMTFHNPFVCSLCGMEATNKTELQQHEKDQHRKRKFQCPHIGCQAKLQSKYEATEHQLKVHGSQDKAMKQKQRFCSLCSITFLTEESKKQHEEENNCRKAILCKELRCMVSFSSVCAMEMHRFITHYKSMDGLRNQFTCFHEGCSEIFKSSISMRNHIDKEHPIINRDHLFVCEREDCTQSFRFQYQLDEHIAYHIMPASESLVTSSVVNSENIVFKKPLACTLCDKEFEMLKGMRRHLGYVHSHELRFGCGIEGCDKVFTNVGYFAHHRKNTCKAAHQLLANGEELPYAKLMSKEVQNLKKYSRVRPHKKFDCDQCGRTYSSHNTWKIHQRLKHPQEIKWFVCNINGCGKKFKIAEYLQRHKLGHKRAKTIACHHPGCNKKFKYLHGMRRHYQKHVAPDGSSAKSYVCTEEGCDAAFCTERSLCEHLDYHRGAFDCKICGRKFRKQYSLKIHMALHEKKETYACDFEGCNKKFHHIVFLKRHKKYHNLSGRKYECPYPGCKARFFYPSQQRQHVGSHTKGKAFCCNWPGCNRIFYSDNYRRSHMRWHLNSKRMYNCNWDGCDLQFSTNYGLHRHIKNIHIARGSERYYGCPVRWCPGVFKERQQCVAHIRKLHKGNLIPKPLGYPKLKKMLHGQDLGNMEIAADESDDDEYELMEDEAGLDEPMDGALMSGSSMETFNWHDDKTSVDTQEEEDPTYDAQVLDSN